jgi:hypothetical protein
MIKCGDTFLGRLVVGITNDDFILLKSNVTSNKDVKIKFKLK